MASVGSEAILPAELLTTTLLPVNIVTDTVANFNFRAPISFLRYPKPKVLFPTVQCVMSGCPVSW